MQGLECRERVGVEVYPAATAAATAPPAAPLPAAARGFLSPDSMCLAPCRQSSLNPFPPFVLEIGRATLRHPRLCEGGLPISGFDVLGALPRKGVRDPTCVPDAIHRSLGHTSICLVPCHTPRFNMSCGRTRTGSHIERGLQYRRGTWGFLRKR